MAANTFTASQALSAFELTRLASAIQGNDYMVSAGGAVTPSSGLTVAVAAVAANTVVIGGTLVSTAYAGGTVTLDAADSTNPRRDIIYYDTSGAVGKITGTPVAQPTLYVAASSGGAVTTALSTTVGPTMPALSETQFALAEVYVAAGDTVADAGDIIDRRQMVRNAALPDVWLPNYPPGGAATAAALAANYAYLIPMQPLLRPAVITKLMVFLGGSTDNIDVGIYSTTDYSTFTRVISLGSTAFPGTNVRHLNITDTTVTPGTVYYSAVGFAGTTATIATVSTATMPTGKDATAAGHFFSKSTSFPLPATISAPTTGSAGGGGTVGPLVAGIISGSRDWTV